MAEVSNTTEILSPPERVWAALVDFENYGKWNPYVAIRGSAAAGGEIEWSLGSTVLKRRIWTKAPVTDYQKPAILAWSFGTRGIFSSAERFTLERTDKGTRMLHTLRYGGLVAILGGSYLRKNMDKIVGQADQGLRRYLAPKAGSPNPSAHRTQQHGRGKSGRTKSRKR